jgi:uncharacterized membrane protein YkvA (DUF1232 family)
MTGAFWWDLALGVAAGLLLAWVALALMLVIVAPRGGLLREVLRLLPDVLRLVRRLAADKTLPRGVRIRLALLLAYLAMPFDLIPDFIPVLGYADDAIIFHRCAERMSDQSSSGSRSGRWVPPRSGRWKA